MKYLRQICIILAICLMGEIINLSFNLPIPGNVIGMITLLFCLYTGIIKIEMIEETADFLLKHLAFFFIPAGVGFISCFGIIKNIWVSFIAIIFISTIIVTIATGLITQLLIRRANK